MEPGRDHAMTNTTDDHHGLPSQPATTTAASTAPLTQPEDVPQESDAQSIGAFSTGLSIDSNDDDIFSEYMDGQSMRSTYSASSSVYEFVEEFGRTYHRYKEGSE